MDFITTLGKLREEGTIEEVFATAVNINTNGKFTAKQIRFYYGTVFNGEPLGDIDYTDFFYPGDEVKFDTKSKESNFSVMLVTEIVIVQRRLKNSPYIEGTGLIVWSENGFGFVRSFSDGEIFMPWMALFSNRDNCAIEDLMPPGTVVSYRAVPDHNPHTSRTSRKMCSLKAASVRKIEEKTAYDYCQSGTGNAKINGANYPMIASKDFGDIYMSNYFAEKIALSKETVIPVRFAVVPVNSHVARRSRYRWDAVQVERLDVDDEQKNSASSSAESQSQIRTGGFSRRNVAQQVPLLVQMVPPSKVETKRVGYTEEKLVREMTSVPMPSNDDIPSILTPEPADLSNASPPIPNTTEFTSFRQNFNRILETKVFHNRFIASKLKQKDERLADGVTLLQILLEEGNNAQNSQVLFKVANRCPNLMETALEWQRF